LEVFTGRNNLNWIITIILALVIMIILPQVFSYSRGYMGYGESHHHLPGVHGMMGYGMFGLWWIVPGIFLVLIIALGVWVGNLLTSQRYQGYSHRKDACPNCGKPLAVDWKTYPYCSEDL
jgi:uncharacterized membrane protein